MQRDDASADDAADVAAALDGLRAAVAVERLPRTTHAQHEAVTVAVNRRIADAIDAGATLEHVAGALNRSIPTTYARFRRGLRDPAEKPGVPKSVLTLSEISKTRRWSVATVHKLRDSGRLPMRRVAGRWVADRRDVAPGAIDLDSGTHSGPAPHIPTRPPQPSPIRRSRSPQTPPPAPPLTSEQAAALLASAARTHRDVPACQRPAPPPWPVHLRCTADLGHLNDHSTVHRGEQVRW